MSMSDYEYSSSILNINYLTEIDKSIKIILEEVTSLYNKGLDKCYLLWSLKSKKYQLLDIREYVTKYVSVFSEIYTIDNVLYHDQISKFSFLVVYIPNKENNKFDSNNDYTGDVKFFEYKKINQIGINNLLEYLSSVNFVNFLPVDINSSIHKTMTSLFKENDLYFDPNGIVNRSFKQILTNIKTYFSQLVTEYRGDNLGKKIELIKFFYKNLSLKKKIDQNCSINFLEQDYLLLYPYINARLKYATSFFDNFKKAITVKRNQMFNDLLNVKNINDFSFKAKFVPLKISNIKETKPIDLEKLPCIPFFRSAFVETVKKREIQLSRFIDILKVNSNNNEIVNKTIIFDPKNDYKSFFANEEIKPYYLMTDNINKNYSNLEYFFNIVAMFAHKANIEEFSFEFEIHSTNAVKRISAIYGIISEDQEVHPIDLSYLLFQDIRYQFVRWSLFHFSVSPFFEDTFKVISYKIF